MKIWCTGIAGFLGSHLAQECIKRGDQVWGNDSLICGERGNVPVGATFRGFACQDRARLLDELVQNKIDVVVHCAATAHEGLSSFSPYFVTENIFGASLSVFSAAIEAKVKRIVNMSSMSRYGAGFRKDHHMGDMPYGAPFCEWYIPKPSDPYAAAKIAAEECLRILCQTHSIAWTTAIPHSIIGTRQRYTDPFRNVASIMINRCLRGDPPIIYGDGNQKRCFSPIADCLPSLLKMIDGQADGETVNIGPDRGEITINELARKIIKFTGYTGKPKYFDERPNEVKLAYCSSEKARTLLGYEEVQSLDECLMDMVEYVKRKEPKAFDWSFPLEIITDKMPLTWRHRML